MSLTTCSGVAFLRLVADFGLSRAHMKMLISKPPILQLFSSLFSSLFLQVIFEHRRTTDMANNNPVIASHLIATKQSQPFSAAIVASPSTEQPAAGALCNECLKLSVDISQGIQRENGSSCLWRLRQVALPTQPVGHGPTGITELLALCLKKLKGLSKVRIIDASFVWTEPHPRG